MTALPAHVAPMLATTGRPFDSPDHYYEVKWDGIRAIAYLEGRSFAMETRNRKALLPRFPELQRIPERLSADGVILDGEVVVFGPDGSPDFDAVRSRNAQKNEASIRASQRARPAVFIVFDCLFADGDNLMSQPLSERLQHLERVVRDEGDLLVRSRGIVGDGTDYFAQVARRGLEGMVAKRLDSPYEPGKRTNHWIKVRNVGAADCVIGGFVPKAERRIKSLVLGLYDERGGLHYIGHVGTGFSASGAAQVRTLLNDLTRTTCPFAAIPNEVVRDAVWTEPALVCTVEFLTLTGQGLLRHPSFKGLRDDKSSEACRLNTELSHVKGVD